MSKLSFNSHHSSWGSYASFVLGKAEMGGGFTLSDVANPNDNVYIAYRYGEDEINLFPFVSGKKAGLGQDAYDFDSDTELQSHHLNIKKLNPEEIQHSTGWCSDSWQSGPLLFSLFTPFGKVPEIKSPITEDFKFWTAPIVPGEIILDNSKGKEVLTSAFAIQNLRRPFSDTSDSLIGTANGRDRGLAALPQEGVDEILDWDILNAAFGEGTFRRLAFDGGLKFTALPGEVKRVKFVLSTFQEGYITSGYDCSYLYSSLFDSIEEVSIYGLKHWDEYADLARGKDLELRASNLNSSAQFLIGHSTRSYLASTQLLLDRQGNVVFVVNEGEYQMMNTLDLSIDQMFFEHRYTPWVTRNILDLFVSRSMYKDNLKGKDGTFLTFSHDMGVANMFTPQGISSYELSGLTGCFSFMCYEELLNWIITAACSGLKGQNPNWLIQKKDLFVLLFDSLNARDGDGDGIMDLDSLKCGQGAEITTYDSLDVSLGQARRNLYIAIKGWAAYLVLARVFETLNQSDLHKKCEKKAATAADAINDQFDTTRGSFPSVFEENNQSRIIPAVEGLIYPYYIGDIDAVSTSGRFGAFITNLKIHIKAVLKKGICIDAQSGGWKLSSTSHNTWMSKIFLNQFVVREILELKDYPWDDWDRIHEDWQKESCGNFAATDQVRSTDGKDLGSRYYPRLVTSILWIK